ncbi:hypothetical protein D3C84_1008130 [compost metagenome]
MIDHPFQLQIQFPDGYTRREARTIRPSGYNVRSPCHKTQHMPFLRMLLAVNHRTHETIPDEGTFIPANWLHNPFHIVRCQEFFPIHVQSDLVCLAAPHRDTLLIP